LNVNSYASESFWTRNTATDLPDYVTNVVCQVANTGNTAASNVNLEIKVDGTLFATKFFSSLQVQAAESYSFLLRMPYDSSRNVFVYASCSDSDDSYSFSIDAKFPRELNSDLAKLFITPKEANVVSLENKILKDKLFITPNWIALRDWVGNNIQYKYDSAVHGTSEYWQFAKETLSLRSGDCEDHAILLCSLLRVSGFSSNDVFVVVGNKGNSYHAWVKLNLATGWYNLEPQENGWNTLIGDFLDLSGYHAIYQFNDYQFQEAK
jgi:hypothetical protein